MFSIRFFHSCLSEWCTCIFTYRDGKWSLRRMLMSGVNWRTQSCPLVIGSLRTDVGTRSEHSQVSGVAVCAWWQWWCLLHTVRLTLLMFCSHSWLRNLPPIFFFNPSRWASSLLPNPSSLPEYFSHILRFVIYFARFGSFIMSVCLKYGLQVCWVNIKVTGNTAALCCHCAK